MLSVATSIGATIMRRIDTRRLTATVALAMLIGAIAGYWTTGPSTASTPAATASSHCGACMSHTWLWLPAMRRAR
jgi:membrane associated rhomboid family serine protease